MINIKPLNNYYSLSLIESRMSNIIGIENKKYEITNDISTLTNLNNDVKSHYIDNFFSYLYKSVHETKIIKIKCKRPRLINHIYIYSLYDDYFLISIETNNDIIKNTSYIIDSIDDVKNILFELYKISKLTYFTIDNLIR